VFLKKKVLNLLIFRKKRLTLHTFTLHQGWGAGKLFSGSLHFFQAAPAPDFFTQAAPAPGIFFKRHRLRPQGAKNTRLRPAPAPDYWLSSPKYSFPHKLVR